MAVWGFVGDSRLAGRAAVRRCEAVCRSKEFFGDFELGLGAIRTAATSWSADLRAARDVWSLVRESNSVSDGSCAPVISCQSSGLELSQKESRRRGVELWDAV